MGGSQSLRSKNPDLFFTVLIKKTPKKEIERPFNK